MTKNMGTIDRTVRTLIAIGILVAYLAGAISGVVAAVLGVIAVVLLATSIVGSCPAYLPIGVSTRRPVQTGE
jgi:hypothetical protein